MNLFEQQALASRIDVASRIDMASRPILSPAPPARRDSTLLPHMADVMRFIEGAGVEQCGKVALHLSARLFALEKLRSGMQAANLNEAAHFAADAAADINGAMQAEDEAPCRCGRCDDCAAARSDELHARRRDALAA